MDFTPVSPARVPSPGVAAPAIRLGRQNPLTPRRVVAADSVRFGASDKPSRKATLPTPQEALSSQEIAARLNPASPLAGLQEVTRLQQVMRGDHGPVDFETFHFGIPTMAANIASFLTQAGATGMTFDEVKQRATPAERPVLEMLETFLPPEVRQRPLNPPQLLQLLERHLSEVWLPSLHEKFMAFPGAFGPPGVASQAASVPASSRGTPATEPPQASRWARKLDSFLDPKRWTPLGNPITWGLIGSLALIPPFTPLALVTIPVALLIGLALASDKPANPGSPQASRAPGPAAGVPGLPELDEPLRQTLSAFVRHVPDVREQTMAAYLGVLNDCAADPAAPAILRDVAQRLNLLQAALVEGITDDSPSDSETARPGEGREPLGRVSDYEKNRAVLDAHYEQAVKQKNAPQKIARFQQQLEALKRQGQLTPQNEAVVRGWLEELASGHSADPGMGMIEKTLTTFFKLPTRSATPTALSEARVREVLDREHWDMTEAKDVVTRYLMKEQHLDALGVPKARRRPEVLCFVGQPGTGKSTLAKAMAEATGRPLAKLSLGGVHKEDDIRGLQRYYMGAKAGGIASELIRTGVNNPVFLLDEIDKMGDSSHHGNPAAALLSVLDPDQNRHFNDHFLDGVDIDLSNVLFACTANDIEKIPGPLRDRMKIIPIQGYLPNEKMTILETHILPRARARNGLDAATLKAKGLLDGSITGEPFTLPQATRQALIAEYGDSGGGLRDMDRLVDTIAQGVARNLRRVGGRAYRASDFPVIQPGDLPQYLDKKYGHVTQQVDPTPKVGQVNMLYYGGRLGGGSDRFYVDVIPQEAPEALRNTLVIAPDSLGPLHGSKPTGGMLGSNLDAIDIDLNFVQKHFDKIRRFWQESPDPTVRALAERYDGKRLTLNFSKSRPGQETDGPSAGAIKTIAMISALTGLPVPGDFAMTGTMDLRGNVGPIDGVREKITGSFQEGINRYLLPRANMPHVVDVPDSVKNSVTITPVDHITDVMAALWGEDNALVKAFREDPALKPYQKTPKTGLRFPQEAPSAA